MDKAVKTNINKYLTIDSNCKAEDRNRMTKYCYSYLCCWKYYQPWTDLWYTIMYFWMEKKTLKSIYSSLFLVTGVIRFSPDLCTYDCPVKPWSQVLPRVCQIFPALFTLFQQISSSFSSCVLLTYPCALSQSFLQAVTIALLLEKQELTLIKLITFTGGWSTTRHHNTLKKCHFVSSRHFSWISRIMKIRVIDLTCELPITEAMANINMVNITLSYLMNTHHTHNWEFLHTRKQIPSCVWMCIRNVCYTYMDASVTWVILLHQHHFILHQKLFTSLQSGPIPSLHTSVPPASWSLTPTIPTAPQHLMADTLGILQLFLFFYKHILVWKRYPLFKL